jgi:hypothetical protein
MLVGVDRYVEDFALSRSCPLSRARPKPGPRDIRHSLADTGHGTESGGALFGAPGTFGVKKAFHATAIRIGKPVFKAMAEHASTYIASDCQLAGHPIAQGIGASGGRTAPLANPSSLLRRAYDS